MTTSIRLLLNVKPKKVFVFVLYSRNMYVYIYPKKNSLAGLSVTEMYGHTTFFSLRRGGVGAGFHFRILQVTTLPLLLSEN
jgi:hypothetical protein